MDEAMRVASHLAAAAAASSPPIQFHRGRSCTSDAMQGAHAGETGEAGKCHRHVTQSFFICLNLDVGPSCAVASIALYRRTARPAPIAEALDAAGSRDIGIYPYVMYAVRCCTLAALLAPLKWPRALHVNSNELTVSNIPDSHF